MLYLGIDGAAGVAAKFSIAAPAWDIDAFTIQAFGPAAMGLPSSPQSIKLGIANDTGLGTPVPGLINEFSLSGVDAEGAYSVVTSDLTLSTGSYWLVVLPATNDSSDFTTIGWNTTSTPGYGNAAGSSNYGASWAGNEEKMMPAFFITGSVIPEPSGIISLAMGLGSLGMILRRRK